MHAGADPCSSILHAPFLRPRRGTHKYTIYFVSAFSVLIPIRRPCPNKACTRLSSPVPPLSTGGSQTPRHKTARLEGTSPTPRAHALRQRLEIGPRRPYPPPLSPISPTDVFLLPVPRPTNSRAHETVPRAPGPHGRTNLALSPANASGLCLPAINVEKSTLSVLVCRGGGAFAFAAAEPLADAGCCCGCGAKACWACCWSVCWEVGVDPGAGAKGFIVPAAGFGAGLLVGSEEEWMGRGMVALRLGKGEG